MLIIGLMFAFNAKAADESRIVLYESKDKTISMTKRFIRYGVDDSGYDACRLYVNDKPVTSEEDGLSCHDYKFYKTELKHIFVFYYENSSLSDKRYWYFINSNDSNAKIVFHERGNTGQIEAIMDKQLQRKIDTSGCDHEVKDKKLSSQKKPMFLGFIVDDKLNYTAKNPSPLSCHYYNLDMGSQPWPLEEKTLGLSKNGSYYYFSAAGKGWTAYYAYDIKANKITKTTLAKINKDKMKLTLVKKF